MTADLIPHRLQPKPLQPGDKIQLVAPARFATSTAIEEAAQDVTAAGFTPVLTEGLPARDGQFGGSDAHRAAELNAAFRDPSIRAVWAMRGGYGCARLLPLLDAEAFRADPTWIIGFSDITALHGWADRQGVAALHAPVATTYARTENKEAMWAKLMAPAAATDQPAVVGGNLSVLYSLLGTPYFPEVTGRWLLLEDLDEYLYHIDRMLCALRLAGVFERAHGLLMGSFSDLHDNTIASGQTADNPFSRSVPEMVAEHVPAGLPVVWDVPVGHGDRNDAVVLGVGGIWSATS
jgi:muramoyltetrapeptide carboxypeptidase